MKAIQTFSPDLLLKAQGIRVAFFDVDGVLTDGSLYYSSKGEDIKQFNTLDGHGLKLLEQAGIMPAIITGRDSLAVRARLQELGITHTSFATKNKVTAASAILEQVNATFDTSAFMGDDWPDLAVMRRCAVCCAPSNAHIEIRHLADYVTTQSGGHGAAREWIDILLLASGRYAALLESES